VTATTTASLGRDRSRELREQQDGDGDEADVQADTESHMREARRRKNDRAAWVRVPDIGDEERPQRAARRPRVRVAAAPIAAASARECSRYESR